MVTETGPTTDGPVNEWLAVVDRKLSAAWPGRDFDKFLYVRHVPEGSWLWLSVIAKTPGDVKEKGPDRVRFRTYHDGGLLQLPEPEPGHPEGVCRPCTIAKRVELGLGDSVTDLVELGLLEAGFTGKARRRGAKG